MRLKTVAAWCTIGFLAGCAGTPDPAKVAAQQHEGSSQILANKNKKGSLLLVRMVDSPLLGDVDCSGYITLRRVNVEKQTRRSRLYLSVPQSRIVCKTQTNWYSASCSPRPRRNMHDGSYPLPLVATSSPTRTAAMAMSPSKREVIRTDSSAEHSATSTHLGVMPPSRLARGRSLTLVTFDLKERVATRAQWDRKQRRPSVTL